MKHSKKFLLLALAFSVVFVVLAAVLYVTHHARPGVQAASGPVEIRSSHSPVQTSVETPVPATSSDAAQKRAKDFNDATSRFNAPDNQ